MNTKNLFAILIIAIAALFYFNFVEPFKVEAVDNISVELKRLQTAYQKAEDQLSLQTLKAKRQALTLQEANILENFVPKRLHSGKFVYDLAQLANQNRLRIKSIQYSVVEDSANKGDKKMQIEFSVEGRYEDFSLWLRTIERGNILIDVDSIRGVKTNNVSDNITFSVKLFTYGIQID